jgi:hypothetical protein
VNGRKVGYFHGLLCAIDDLIVKCLAGYSVKRLWMVEMSPGISEVRRSESKLEQLLGMPNSTAIEPIESSSGNTRRQRSQQIPIPQPPIEESNL